jgi:hypothetical protein
MQKILFFVLCLLFLFAPQARARCARTPNVGLEISTIGAPSGWSPCPNNSFGLLDPLLGGSESLTPNSATPAVAGAGDWITANTVATTITNFRIGFPGQQIRVLCGDMLTRISSGTNMSLTGIFSCANSTAIQFILKGHVWTEIGRASPGSTPAYISGDFQTNNSEVLGSGARNAAKAGVLGNFSRRPNCGANSADIAMRFVDPSGSDSNDGCSWGSAMRTIRGALVSLPGGSTSPDVAGVGTVYFTNGVAANTTGTGCGIWLMGSADPNFASPPSCWIKYRGTALSIIGVPTTNNGPNPHLGRTELGAGSSVDRNHPGIYLSNTQGPLNFQNISIAYPGRGVVIGECSNQTRTATCNSNGMTFINVTVGLNAVAGNGPAWDITGQSFWIWLRDCGGGGTDEVNPPTSDLSPAFLLDGRNSAGVGLIFISDSNAADGGIKVYSGTNGSQVVVQNFTTEGQHGEPAVWIAASGETGDGLVSAKVDNVEVADATTTTAGLEVDVPANDVVASNIQGQGINVVGGATVLSQYSSALSNTTETPLRQGQIGFFGRTVVGQNDNADRGFPPTVVRFRNLALTDSAQWITSWAGSVTSVTKSADLAGGTNAGHIAYVSGGQGATAIYTSINVPVTVGDYWIFQAWVRSASANGYSEGAALAFQLGAEGYGAGDYCNGTTSGAVLATGLNLGDGNWERVWGVCQISVARANAGIDLVALTDATHKLEVYGPTLIHIPIGTVSNNEAWAIASALKSYSNTCSVGTLCNVAGNATFSTLGQMAASQYGGVSACSGSTKAIALPITYNSQPVIMIFDETTAGGAKLSAKSARGFTVTCAGASDSFDWMVIGNPN